MNTIDELVKNGISKNNAKQMLDSYNSKIGTINGVYIIKDINYDHKNKRKDVTLKCTMCGKEIHRFMVHGKNKWSELKKTCDCKKDSDRKNREKLKKDKIEAMKERVGQCFGDYEIISLEDVNDKPKYTMRCLTCDSEKIVSASAFDTRTNFHCTKHYVQPIKFDENYIGKKNNYLTVMGFIRTGKDNHRAFLCQCDCGNIKAINTTDWEKGIVKSCGCMRPMLGSENAKTHGLSKKRIYRVRAGMIQRCYNQNDDRYENYGGRGIKICDEWLNSPKAFCDWAYANGYDENAPKGECTIDRIDVNGNYEPSNCRWITNTEQQKNKRPSSEWKKQKPKYELDGVPRTMQSICEEYDISDAFIRYRINVMHMTLSEAVKTPKKVSGRPRTEARYE